MTVETTTRALLGLVENDRMRRCGVLLDAARAEAAHTLAQAHADARARMRRTFAEERERHAARIAAANAELATRRRLAEQRRTTSLLAAGWKLLSTELVRRWSDPMPRRLWVEYVVALARSRLPHGSWTLTHPPDWPEAERTALAVTLDVPPTFVPRSAHRAGLAIGSAGIVIDGTLDGLMADRNDVAAQLLFELQHARARTEVTA